MGPMQNAIRSIEQASSFYLKDLEAMSEERILGSVGGCARKPLDFSYETGLVNLRIAARLRGTEPPPEPEGEEWWTAPKELQSKSAIMAYVKEASDELLSAAKAIPEEESGKLVGAPGNERPAFAVAQFASMHMMYHDAQLNFIQAMDGDLAMHWS